MDYDPIPVLQRVRTPLLVLFGAEDRWVPSALSVERILEATAGHEDVTILNIPGADHYLKVPGPGGELDHSPNYLTTLEEWLVGHLDL